MDNFPWDNKKLWLFIITQISVQLSIIDWNRIAHGDYSLLIRFNNLFICDIILTFSSCLCQDRPIASFWVFSVVLAMFKSACKLQQEHYWVNLRKIQVRTSSSRLEKVITRYKEMMTIPLRININYPPIFIPERWMVDFNQW